MAKEILLGKTLEELTQVILDLKLPKFTAKQIADWLYKKDITSIDEMLNLSLKARTLLKDNFDIGLTATIKEECSIDGTKKYLYPTNLPNHFIETAYIPDEDRSTLCISCQVGCKMGCLFCMTGKQGFQGQLSSGDIINQVRSLPEWHKLTNIVYMGMGEPMDNVPEVMKSLEILTADYGMVMSPRRITVSTIGIIPGMKKFLNESECHLAVSLHTPFDDERKKLMPVQNVYPIKDVLKMIREFDFGRQRRVSFEYIMLKGINDTPNHVKELCKILDGIKCRMNLIRFHPIPNSPLLGSDETTIEEFKDLLNKKGITTTIRRSRGLDIFAACGLLSTKELMKQQNKDL
jgi:23S rRNA (adenine2503-C2)-methyltransferase